MSSNQKTSIWKLYKSLWFHLNKRKKNQLYFVVLLSIFVSFAEVISIASLMPFIAIFTNFEETFSNKTFKLILEIFNVESKESAYVFVTIGFCSITIITIISRIILVASNIRISHSVSGYLIQKMYRLTINQKYDELLSMDLTNIISIISTKSNVIASSVLASIVNITNSSLIIIFIIIGLLYLNPVLSLIIFVSLGSIYFSITYFTRKKLKLINKIIIKLHPNLLGVLKDSFAGLKELILFRLHDGYSNDFDQFDNALRHSIGSRHMIGQMPRVIIEGVVILTIAILTFIFASDSNSIISNLPIIGTVIIAIQRLLPNFQNIYVNISQIIGSKLEVLEAVNILSLPTRSKNLLTTKNEFKNFKVLEFNSVSFKFKSNNKFIIKDANFKIIKGDKVAVIGPSGSGKSCLLDMMLGLLNPSKGTFKVNGVLVDDLNAHHWLNNISYVPQDVFLLNTTILQNITFTNIKSELNNNKINHLMDEVCLSETLDNWDQGLDKSIGDSGNKISGGQKQRIGIARALYKKSDVLFLDEATSALDAENEKKILNNIFSNYKELTIIMVTHRKELLKYFDVIYEIKNQKINRIK